MLSEPGMIIANLSGIFQFFWLHSSVFILEKKHKNLSFQSFLPLRDTLVATFNKRHTPTFTKFVPEQGIVERYREISIFFVVLLRFCFKKTTEKDKYLEFFTSRRTFGGYVINSNETMKI